jgi:hypothetical protein
VEVFEILVHAISVHDVTQLQQHVENTYETAQREGRDFLMTMNLWWTVLTSVWR